MIKKILNFINQQTLFGEIMRFFIVGGIATVIDFFAMGVTLYILEPSGTYPKFYNVFYGGGSPSLLSNIIGTGVGFIFGLIANYFLSVIFVFNEKGKSKSINGFIKFTVISIFGLAIHEVGMYVFNGICGWNEWIVKIFLTCIVLVYNYITKRIFIFKNNSKPKTAENEESPNPSIDEK